MKALSLVIQNPTGLHARPAKYLVNLAKRFESDVSIHYGEKVANAKSLISILKLGVKTSSEIEVHIAGPDEQQASEEISHAVHNGLGEGTVTETPAADSSPPKEVLPAEAEKQPEHLLQGVGASTGIVTGRLFQLKSRDFELPTDFQGVEKESAALVEAIASAADEVEALHEHMLSQNAAAEAEIFAAHSEMLHDPQLKQAVQARIKQKTNAPQAWWSEIEDQANELAQVKDELLSARAADVRDIGRRVLNHLLGKGAQTDWTREIVEPVILVARDLTPSDTAQLDKSKVIGIATVAGGPNAHSAIIARALGIPAVVAMGDSLLKAPVGQMAILDGQAGVLNISPTASELKEAEKRHQAADMAAAEARKTAHLEAITVDGRKIEVAANAGSVEDARKAAAAGADGIGLLRTEFIFIQAQTAPTEEEQTEIYAAIASEMNGRPVILRTLDIGGDKPVPYIDIEKEENPFLGERGIRLALNRPQLLKTQLRAILRSAAQGSLRIMFPMIGQYHEWQAARQMVEEVRQEVGAPAVEVGMMIEVPSAALLAETFAPEIDFFSIGTNDLTQYTLAIDRQHPILAAEADGLHPAVLQLIARTVAAAHAHGKWVGVCGELGADPAALPVLLGLGVDELSVNTSALPMVKAQIRTLSFADCRKIAQQALHCRTAAEVRNLSNLRKSD
ncbi:MAG: phosphoenolpyruvate--protein phosphotransferase [Ardenticatenaceae bacterium]|nr:phosphoenolpyruvate--protein phosphotransferase [Ardenticatenaceae bacterium]